MEEEDSYSSSGDESSSKQGTLKTDVQEDADKQMENSLEDEQNKVIAISQTLLKEEDTMKCIHKFNLMNSFSNSHFQDILPQIVDGKKFLIDGDSLLLYALSNKGLSIEAGGTMLHITYIVERFLLTFVSRGLNFIVVFFEIWNRGWSFFPQFSIARNAVKLHLLYNQKIFPVLIMDYLWSNEFLSLLHIQRPGFIVMSTTIPKLREMTKSDNDNENTAELWLQFLCDSQRVCCDMAFLDVVDIASISSSHVSLMGMVHIHSNRYTRVQNDITALIRRIVELMPIQKKVENLKPIDFPEGDIKIMAIVAASALTLNKNLTILTEDVIKTILLCTATAEVTPLKRRCFKNLPKLPRCVIEVIRNFQEELAGLLSTAPTKSKSIDFKSVGDMWQGLLFNAVYNFVHKASVLEKCNLESVIALRYELLVSYLNKLMLKEKLQAFPIKSAFEDPAVEGSVKTLLDQPFSPPKPQLLLPSTCELELLFCGQIASDTPLLKYTEIEDVEGADFLHEWRHWHSKIKLTDEGERIIDRASQPQKYVPNPRYAQSMRNKYARYLTLYGSSIEGRSIAPKAIVVSEVKKNSRTSEKKESKLKDRRETKFQQEGCNNL